MASVVATSQLHVAEAAAGAAAGGGGQELAAAAVAGGVSESPLSLAAVLAAVTWLAGAVANVFFLVGPVLIYVPQYKSIRATGLSGGFSTNVCLVLLAAHVMRCFFWVGKRFETVQLLQSVVVVLSQLVLLRACVHCSDSAAAVAASAASPPPTPGSGLAAGVVEMTAVAVGGGGTSPRPREPQSPGAAPGVAPARGGGGGGGAPPTARTVCEDLSTRRFWAWERFRSYVAVVVAYSLFLSGLTVMFLDNPAYFEVIGFVGLFLEATLAMPQALRNHRRRSTEGLSLFLVFNWIAGDTVRFLIYYLRGLPAQFLLSAGLSIAINSWVLLQVAVLFPNPRLQAWWASARRGEIFGGHRSGEGVARMVSWLVRSRARRSSTDTEAEPDGDAAASSGGGGGESDGLSLPTFQSRGLGHPPQQNHPHHLRRLSGDVTSPMARHELSPRTAALATAEDGAAAAAVGRDGGDADGSGVS